MVSNPKFKICPYCAEEIEFDSQVCKYCLSSLTTSWNAYRQPSWNTCQQGETKESQWYRSREGKMIAGVCQGLARHFDIPVFPIRLAFVIAAIFGGWGLFIYFYLWLLMPCKR